MDGLHDEPRSGAPRTVDDARIEAVIVRTLERLPRERHPLEFPRHGRRPAACRCRLCNGSGGPSGSSRTGWRRSSSRQIETSWPKCAMSWAFTSRRRSTPSFYVWMRNPKSRRWTAVSRCCRCVQANRPEEAMTTQRHGTTSLFAALDIASGRVIGKCYGRHRAAEFRKFLDEIEAAVPPRSRRPSRHGQLRHAQDPS